MTSWIEWVACGAVVVIACMFDQIIKEAEREEAAQREKI